jgi:hypothetical protein
MRRSRIGAAALAVLLSGAVVVGCGTDEDAEPEDGADTEQTEGGDEAEDDSEGEDAEDEAE